MSGIYIHIPFCKQFCTYCNFYSVKSSALKGRFVESVKAEILSKKDFSRGVSTIYFGGGTPSTLSIQELSGILTCLQETFEVAPNAEISIEVNPDDITTEYAAGLVAAGFNRVSMGVQSFVDEHLIWMNRRHNSAKAVEAYRILRDAGIKNISLDLIFGYSLLTSELWQYNLNKMIELAPEHVSAYQMSVEPGSRLSGMLKKGEYELPPDNICEEQYKALQKSLVLGGYEQYEISNFSKPGFHSRHNSSYWDKTPYLGLGPAAHSYNRECRFWNTESVKKYCDYYLCGEGEEVSDCEVLSGKEVFNESIMLGLRTVKGVNTTLLEPSLLTLISPAIKREISCGNLISSGTFLRIPTEYLFVSDAIIRELFIS